MSRVSYRRSSRDAAGEPRLMMARPLHEPRWIEPARRSPRSLRQLVGPAVLVLVGGAALIGMIGVLGTPPGLAGQASSTPSVIAGAASPSPSVAEATPRPSPTRGTSSVGTPRATPTPQPTARPTEPARPSPSTTPRPAEWAPQSAADFDQVGGEVIDIAFPFQPGTRYRYRDNWFDVRAGAPEEYNHVHSRRRGEVRRAHDGIDIYAPRGSAIVAPFAGTVIDPSTRWSPWHERYGTAVVIVSSEPQSEGYAAVLSHLDVAFVEPGTQVRRGEVVGLAGDTGNADGYRVHLHFELRAPFALPWLELGGERLVDAFNPYPSLVAADPKRD